MHTINNAVINGVLCFVSTARESYNEQSIISICISFFNSDKFSKQKSIKFALTKETPTIRQGDGKSKADINDIIQQLKKNEEESVTMPKFLADSYKSIPPSSEFQILADHIVHLMDVIHSLLK